MHTPIKERTFIKHEDYDRITNGNYHLYAGESALRSYNLIVDTTTFALPYKELKNSKWDRSNYAIRYYEGYDEIQQWYYDPKKIITMIPSINRNYEQKYIDPISLYLSIKEDNTNDIRVIDAVETLLESIKREYEWEMT